MFVSLIVLLTLGTWQVERLYWKENLLATIHQRMSEAPMDIEVLADSTTIEYRRATASGIFLNDKEMTVTAISLNGEGGYHVLTPLKLAHGKFLLVDRGWVPYSKQSPDTRRDSSPSGITSITGVLRLPHHHWMQPANVPEQNLWYGIDLPAMAKAAGISEFLPFVLEADATPNPGGYPVGGQTRVELPNNHFVYALTWYGLALALAVIFGISCWQRDDKA